MLCSNFERVKYFPFYLFCYYPPRNNIFLQAKTITRQNRHKTKLPHIGLQSLYIQCFYVICVLQLPQWPISKSCTKSHQHLDLYLYVNKENVEKLCRNVSFQILDSYPHYSCRTCQALDTRRSVGTYCLTLQIYKRYKISNFRERNSLINIYSNYHPNKATKQN